MGAGPTIGRDAYVRSPLYGALRVAERFGLDPVEWIARVERGVGVGGGVGVGVWAVLAAYCRVREEEEAAERAKGGTGE